MNDEEAEWSVEQALLGRGDTLRERIAALPRLLSNPTSTIPCRICATAAIAFDVVDYHKACGADPYRFGMAGVLVTYYRCPSCCCIFTNFFDRWSPQDFKRFIYNRDYELVDPEFDGPRAPRIAAELAPLLGLATARVPALRPRPGRGRRRNRGTRVRASGKLRPARGSATARRPIRRRRRLRCARKDGFPAADLRRDAGLAVGRRRHHPRPNAAAG